MTYDMLVIGAGSGGLAVAKAAAKYGAKVAIAESNAVGGTCVNRGCIPKKLMMYAADVVEQQQVSKSYGWINPEGLFDWGSLKLAMTQHLKHIRQSQQQTLDQAGIDLIAGTARFVTPNSVSVGNQTVEAEHIVIAVGSQPMLPDIPGKELALTSKDMFELDQLPKQLAIVGGGYIGVEFSHILAQLGSQVTLIDTDKQVLAGFDNDLQAFVQKGLQGIGVDFIPETTCKEVEANASKRVLSLSGQHSQTLMTDAVLMAVGRKPNLDGLDLEQVGVELDDGKIAVDQYGCTSQPSIYAIGDCVGRLPLTPVAIAEGKAVAKTIYQQQPTAVDYRWIPSAVFGKPPVATVGWSEAKARDNLGDEVQTVCQQFSPLSQSLIEQPQKTLIKVVFAKSSGQILGMHIAGNHGPELIQGLLPSLRRGLNVDELTDTVGIHPTTAEEFFDLPFN